MTFLFIFSVLITILTFGKGKVKVLNIAGNYGKMLTVRDGYLICPRCRRNKRLMKINPDTEATRVVAYCRDCKTENIVDIYRGQCYESRSQ